MAGKYNGSAEDIDGFISRAVKVEADEGKYLVTVDPESVQVVEDGDFYKVVIVAPIFRHHFQNNFNPAKINEEVTYVQVELPEMFFSKEVRLVCKTGRSVELKFSSEPVPKEEQFTHYVPKIVVKGDDEDDGD